MNWYKKVIGETVGLMVAVLATILVLNILASAYLPEASTCVHSTGTIKASTLQFVYGDKIFDENGREVMWRGAGGSYLFHAGDHYQEAWQLHLPEIQAMGLNTIRLAFAFPDSAPNPEYGTPSADVLDFARMDWVLDFLNRNNIKGILDLHNYGDMREDFGSLRLMDNWRNVAQHYRGDPRVAAYELFNEPESYTWASSVRSKTDVARVYAELTDAIRKIDPDHIVIWQTPDYIPPLEEIITYLRPNTVFTFHRWWIELYKRKEFETWTVEQISYMSLSYPVRYREILKVPFWFGEFGAEGFFNSSNPQWLLTEQHLWRCEEQVVGWNLWMGKTAMYTPWDFYMPFFPLKMYNTNLDRQPWCPPRPNFIGYIVDSKGADLFDPYRIQLWHSNDFVIFKPGIVIRVITEHKLTDGTIEVASDEQKNVTQQLTILNQEETPMHPGDWNVEIFSVGYIDES